MGNTNMTPPNITVAKQPCKVHGSLYCDSDGSHLRPCTGSTIWLLNGTLTVNKCTNNLCMKEEEGRYEYATGYGRWGCCPDDSLWHVCTTCDGLGYTHAQGTTEFCTIHKLLIQRERSCYAQVFSSESDCQFVPVAIVPLGTP